MEDVTDNKKTNKKPAVVELTKKQELNNHIVLMRKVVRTARVHIINKLTKDVKKLKDRKGDEKALEKTKRKLERFLQEIQAIKHLREDKVSIFALQDKTTKLEDVLQDPKASIQKRALSRFSHNKLIQGEVAKYRTRNIYWDLQIPVLLERSKDKRRRINKKLAEREAELLLTGGNSQKKKETNVDKDLSVSEEDSLSELDSEEEDGNQEHDANNSSGDEGTEDIEGLGLTKKLVKPKTKLKNSTSTNKKVNTKKQKKQQQVSTTKTVKIQPPTKEISKTEGTVRVQHLKDLTDLENSEIIINKPTEITTKLTVKDLSLNAPKLRPKSSFFVGGVDEIVVEEPSQQEKRELFDKKNRGGGGQSNFHSKQNYNNNDPSKEFKPLFRKGKLVNKPSTKSFNNNNNSNKGSRISSRGGEGKNFKGRFETDGGANSNLTPLGDKKKEGIKIPNNPQQKSSSTAQSEEKLHPSWEAKKRQQQQPALSVFKGKKIKFDDD